MTLYKEKSFLHLQKRNSYLQSRENLLASRAAQHLDCSGGVPTAGLFSLARQGTDSSVPYRAKKSHPPHAWIDARRVLS